MLSVFLALNPMTFLNMEESTFVAVGLGGSVTFFLALRKGRPITTVIGWVLASIGAGIFLSRKVGATFGLRESEGGFLVSALGFLWIPWITKRFGTLMDKKLGVDYDEPPGD